MKKLFAFILVLTSLSVGCIFPSLGAFAMNNVDSSMHEEMNHDMQSDIWMHGAAKDDWEDIHECCVSPFIDTITPSSNLTLSQSDVDIDDAAVLYAMYESLLSNNSDRLNSPPKRWLLFNDSLKNTYVSLVGIVKNNS
jgi:hypothetical protein